jgi:hypothetical protein
MTNIKQILILIPLLLLIKLDEVDELVKTKLIFFYWRSSRRLPFTYFPVR